MKKLFSKALLIILCFAITVMTTYAAVEWVHGYDFLEKGTTYNKEVTRGKTFKQGLYAIYFYEGNTINIELSARKKLLGVYANKIDEKICPVTSTTTSCAIEYAVATSNNNVQLRWKQANDGQMNAELYYPAS